MDKECQQAGAQCRQPNRTPGCRCGSQPARHADYGGCDQEPKRDKTDRAEVRKQLEVQVIRMHPVVPPWQTKVGAVDVSEIIWAHAEHGVVSEHSQRCAPELDTWYGRQRGRRVAARLLSNRCDAARNSRTRHVYQRFRVCIAPIVEPEHVLLKHAPRETIIARRQMRRDLDRQLEGVPGSNVLRQIEHGGGHIQLRGGIAAQPAVRQRETLRPLVRPGYLSSISDCDFGVAGDILRERERGRRGVRRRVPPPVVLGFEARTERVQPYGDKPQDHGSACTRQRGGQKELAPAGPRECQEQQQAQRSRKR